MAEILYEKKGYYLEKAILSYFDQILVKQEVIHPKSEILFAFTIILAKKKKYCPDRNDIQKMG